MHCSNAGGETAPMLLVVAIKEMPEEEFEVYTIDGLRCTASVGETGYVAFCKTRGGCSKLWRWFFVEFVLVFVKKLRKTYDFKNADGTPMRTFVYLDGEACILKEIFDPKVLELVEECGVDAGKGIESGSGYSQSSDVASTFRNCKTGLKTICRRSINIHCDVIFDSATKAFKSLQEKYHIVLSAKFRAKVIDGMMRISYCVSNYMTPRSISKGFHDAGQYLTEEEIKKENATISFSKIMQNCDFPFTHAQMNIMKEATPELVAACRLTGKTTDAHMDLLNIPRMDGEANTVERTKKVYNQRPAYLLTHVNSVANYRDYQQIALDNANPEIISARKSRASAEK